MKDAEVDICIKSPLADYAEKPLRFALRLEELGGDKEEDSTENTIGGEPNKGTDHHLSQMETEMRCIEYMMHTMLKEGDLSKDCDSIDHCRTDAACIKRPYIGPLCTWAFC